jgi:membrane-associated phospholipid phosphatase
LFEDLAVAYDPNFSRLLRKSAVAILLCAALVVLCYFFVDRPFAFFVYENHFAHYSFLRWLTLPPPIIQTWAPVALVVLMLLQAWGPLPCCGRAVLAAAVSIILAEQFRETLAYVFGRTWPETWVDNNPSLIRDDAYGFHPFHGGRAYGSFPSGHTARTLAVAAVVWITYPGWRWAAVAASAAVALGLLGMNYHFVSDVIAGGFVGGLVGTYTAYFCGLAHCPAAGAMPHQGA